MLVEDIFEIPGRDPSKDFFEYKGYHNPSQRWNGWATPEFTKEVAEKILQDGNYKYRFDNDKLFAILDEDYGEEEIGMRETEFGKLYGVGSYYWIWDEKEKQ